jgi:hypothetical protein
MAGTRGEIKSDDIDKIRPIQGCTVMFAGDNSHAHDLIYECEAAIESYAAGSDELAITKLKLSLNEASRKRKRAIADSFVSSKFGLSYDAIFNFSNANPNNPFYADRWDDIKRLTLGAELIITTFTDDEAAILVMPLEGGEAKWPTHYAVIGSGAPIASAFLRQKAYDDEMEISECLYRVLEAKTAAEGNPYVGMETLIEVSTPQGSFEVDERYIDRVLNTIERRREQIPKIKFDPKFLKKIDDDPPTIEVRRSHRNPR